MEILFPHGVQVPIDGFRSFLRLAHLDSDIWVAGARLVLGLQALGTYHWRHRTNTNMAVPARDTAEAQLCGKAPDLHV